MSSTKKALGISLIITSGLTALFFPIIADKSNLSTWLDKEREVNAPFLVDHENMIVFWGYVGCPSVCPVSLAAINEAYRKFKSESPQTDLGVSFIALPIPGKTTTPADADQYAKIFSPDFNGYFLPSSESYTSQKQFGVFTWLHVANREEISHTGYIYFLQNRDSRWIVKQTYTIYPPQPDSLVQILRELTTENIVQTNSQT